MRARLIAVGAMLWLAGCASQPSTLQREENVLRFSEAPLSVELPKGWNAWALNRFARKTDYRIVEAERGHVLEAHAKSSSSGLLQNVDIDPHHYPVLTWAWKATQLIEDADTSHLATDDSPTRIIVAFDGDRNKFDFEDRAIASMAKLISGREMPYATLMYVWDNKLPVGSVFEHPRSSRLKTIVVESGPARVGQWLTFRRNIVADYRKAFGEEPGRIEAVGVMTDTNATNSNITAYYGDIEFHSAPPLTAADIQ